MNRDAYNKVAQQWGEARSGFFKNERHYLDTLLAPLPPGSTVLDLGCGTGRPMAEQVVASGHRVIGVDQSEAMLEQARRRLPDQCWLLSPMEHYVPDRDFQAAIIWDSIFHLPRSEHAGILQRVVERLPGGGRLMLTVGGSSHPAFTDFMFGVEFFYDSNLPEETEQILRDCGCRLLIGEFMNLPDGARNKGRYAIVAEKC